MATEFLHVEEVCSRTDFLVGVECNTYLAVLDFGMLHEVGHGGHYFGDARFVVGTQQGMAVGDYEVLSHVCLKLGELLHRCDDAFVGVEYDVGAVIVVYDARADVGTAAVGTGVHVGDEADGGHGLVGIGGEGGIHIGMLVHLHFGQSDGLELPVEVACQVPLLVGAGALCLVLLA